MPVLENPYLNPGDVITIQRLERRVTIDGQVERQGSFQLIDGDNLKTLIDYLESNPQSILFGKEAEK